MNYSGIPLPSPATKGSGSGEGGFPGKCLHFQGKTDEVGSPCGGEKVARGDTSSDPLRGPPSPQGEGFWGRFLLSLPLQGHRAPGKLSSGEFSARTGRQTPVDGAISCARNARDSAFRARETRAIPLLVRGARGACALAVRARFRFSCARNARDSAFRARWDPMRQHWARALAGPWEVDLTKNACVFRQRRMRSVLLAEGGRLARGGHLFRLACGQPPSPQGEG